MAILAVNNLTVREGGAMVLNQLSFCINPGEQWAVAGPSGSGKTTLLLALAGKRPYSGAVEMNAGAAGPAKMVMVMQQHRFRNLSNTADFYYQQRYNSYDADDAITVAEDLQRCITGLHRTDGTDEAIAAAASLLHLTGLLPVKLIQLSNGENKRLQIAKALLLQPSLLLLDSPYTGLDTASRKILDGLLQHLAGKAIHIILTTTPGQVPACITHVLTLTKNGGYRQEDAAAFRSGLLPAAAEPAFIADEQLLAELTSVAADDHFAYAVQMKAVTISYNNRLVLDSINWSVAKGERWALSGPNGSGKSTLLSLINADNPQAYANKIWLFDRRRGTGESIWDIKKRIGFLSPELHLYFDTSANCFDVVASGLFDTAGLFRALNDTQLKVVTGWMQLLQVYHLRGRLLLQLSGSEQRLVLLARALVKNPPLLILDEPCQGLDEDQVALFKSIVNAICLQTAKTLMYVSHYPHEIPGCVNRFMRLGEYSS